LHISRSIPNHLLVKGDESWSCPRNQVILPTFELGCQATVHKELGAGDERGFIAGQEGGCVANILWPAKFSQELFYCLAFLNPCNISGLGCFSRWLMTFLISAFGNFM